MYPDSESFMPSRMSALLERISAYQNLDGNRFPSGDLKDKPAKLTILADRLGGHMIGYSCNVIVVP